LFTFLTSAKSMRDSIFIMKLIQNLLLCVIKCSGVIQYSLVQRLEV
jgi:hypothetical protein